MSNPSVRAGPAPILDAQSGNRLEVFYIEGSENESVPESRRGNAQVDNGPGVTAADCPRLQLRVDSRFFRRKLQRGNTVLQDPFEKMKELGASRRVEALKDFHLTKDRNSASAVPHGFPSLDDRLEGFPLEGLAVDRSIQQIEGITIHLLGQTENRPGLRDEGEP